GYVHTAGANVVHQFFHLGSFSFLGGGSVVSQDVPKYTMVAEERAELQGLNLDRGSGRQDSCGSSIHGDYRCVDPKVKIDFDPNSLQNILPKAVSSLEWAISKGKGRVYVYCTAGLGRAPG
ncbi:hypothetical protein S83_028735, partial [Arachis hypogaea]